MEQQNVEEGREAKFAVGEVKGVGAVLNVPSNEGVEEFGIEPFCVERKRGDVNAA